MSTTSDSHDPAPSWRPTGRSVVVAGVVLGAVVLVATVAAMALHRRGDDRRAGELTVTWAGSEGHPPCVYDRVGSKVTARLTVDGAAPRDRALTVTVTAYADENTSVPVGSRTETLRLEGEVHRSLAVSIPVQRAPHVDEDGVTACRLTVEK